MLYILNFKMLTYYSWKYRACPNRQVFFSCSLLILSCSGPGPETSTGEDNRCSYGWKYLSNTNKCYKLNSNKLSWKKALEYCKIASPNPTSSLSSIPDSDTNKFLATLTSDMFWTGDHQNSEDDWVWSDGSQWTGFTKWNASQPNNWMGKQHFIESNFENKPGFWNDGSEDTERVSVCQYDWRVRRGATLGGS